MCVCVRESASIQFPQTTYSFSISTLTGGQNKNVLINVKTTFSSYAERNIERLLNIEHLRTKI